jgi:hypothetical protein
MGPNGDHFWTNHNYKTLMRILVIDFLLDLKVKFNSKLLFVPPMPNFDFSGSWILKAQIFQKHRTQERWILFILGTLLIHCAQYQLQVGWASFNFKSDNPYILSSQSPAPSWESGDNWIVNSIDIQEHVIRWFVGFGFYKYTCRYYSHRRIGLRKNNVEEQVKDYKMKKWNKNGND